MSQTQFSFDQIKGNVVSVKDFGATGDGVTDDTAAIQAAIDSLGTAAGTIHFPTGVYLVTSTLRISYSRQNLVGAGRFATRILFTPTANDTCIHVEKTDSTVVYQGHIRDLCIWSDESTYEKIGINLVDVSTFVVDSIVIGGSVAVGNTGLFSGGAGGSVGLQTNGRETCTFNNLHIYAQTCISLRDNPNNLIDVDHFHFSNCYLQGGTGGSYPIWNIDSGVNVTFLTIDGFQAWTGGNAGLVWVDTATAQTSLNVVIKNVRHEGSTNASGQMLQIEHNTKINGLLIENCLGALSQLGIKIRNALNVEIKNTLMLCTTGSALNVDSSVTPLKLDHFNRQAGSTVDTGTLVKVFDTGIFSQGGPSFSYWQDPAVITTAIFNTPVSGTKQTVANDGTISVGAAATTRGLLMVDTSDNVGAIYYLGGAGDTTREVSESHGGFFSVTQGTASSYNIYYDAGGDDYKIENKRGGNRDIRYLLIGGVN